MLLELKHHISKTASNELWSLAKESFPKLVETKKRHNIRRKIPRFRSIRQKLNKTKVPLIYMDVAYECKETGDVILLEDLHSTPVHRFPPSHFTKLYEVAYVKMKDILNIHENKCKKENPYRAIQISLDGVSECRSNTNSLDVYSLRFKNCNCVYPHTLVRPVSKYKIDHDKYFDRFLKDLHANSCCIKAFVGDNLKRAKIRRALNHASLYACEYCCAKATSQEVCSKIIETKKKKLQKEIDTIQQRISTLTEQDAGNRSNEEIKTLSSILDALKASLKDISRKKKQVVWPSSTISGEARTRQKIEEITNMLLEDANVDYDVAQGFVGRSLLLEYKYFNFVRDIPTEYLHSVCLGVVKRLIELTFNVGTSRPRATKRKLTPSSAFNVLMAKIKCFREFARRSRNLDFSVMKGQEFRNIICFYFPIVVQTLELNAKERHIWLLLAYMIRSCIIPTKEFQATDLNKIRESCQKFYSLYEKTFGSYNCSYNTHIVSSHLSEMRAHGPLTLTSAFGFENFYGEMRKSFVPGTVSPLKQILSNVILKRSIGPHCCDPSITLTNHETSLESNNYVYTYTNNTYNCYKIHDIDENKLYCSKIETATCKFTETPNLDWSKVGVFKEKKILSEITEISHDMVAGKLIRVQDLILTCPKNILDEK